MERHALRDPLTGPPAQRQPVQRLEPLATGAIVVGPLRTARWSRLRTAFARTPRSSTTWGRLAVAAQALRDLAAAPADPADWQRALDELGASLASMSDAEPIRALLLADELDELPIAAKTAGWERVLALGLRTPEVLRAFADHLWLHGPDEDGRVEELLEEASRSS